MIPSESIVMLYFHSSNQQLIRQEIYACLTLFNFSRIIINNTPPDQKEEWKYHYKVNFKTAITNIRLYLDEKIDEKELTKRIKKVANATVIRKISVITLIFFDTIIVMMDTTIHAKDFYVGNYDDCDKLNYDPSKPRIKSILWDNLDWIEELYSRGKLRDTVLDNVQKTLLCKTDYLGYDYFECPHCGNFNIIYHHCHSRLCTSCGVKYQKTLAIKAETMCLDVNHWHIVFTIPEQYRYFFRKNRQALDFLFVAARNTIMKIVNENIYKKEKRKRSITGKIRNDKDNYYLYRNFDNANKFGMIATLHTFGRSLQWNPHIIVSYQN